MKNQAIKKILARAGLYGMVHTAYVHTLGRSHLRRLQGEREFYGQFVRPGDLCFDIGANVGDKAEALLALGAKVVAVEPQPSCVSILKSRFAGRRNFTCVPMGIGERSGRLPLYSGKANIGAASFVRDWQGEPTETIDVDVTTLDALVEEYGRPRYCKIDVEGFELLTLRGLSAPIDFVSFEYHLTEGEIPLTIECLELLSKLGRQRVRVNIASSIPFDTGTGSTTFLRRDWWKLDEFVEYFRTELPDVQGYFYGDIYVRSVDT